MSEIEILERVVAYESTHSVENYIVNGWHVWPLLRCLILWMHEMSSGPRRVSVFRALLRRHFGSVSLIGKRLLPLRRYLSHLSANYRRLLVGHGKVNELINKQADVIFLTLSERRVIVNSTFYEIYTDPFVELLSELGFGSLVWEEGVSRHPQYSESVNIFDRLASERVPLPRKLKEPDWFFDYMVLVDSIIGRKIAWTEIAYQIELVTNFASVFELWMRIATARFLFVVCWYNPIAMAATMAARRCGIKTIDIQHGYEGKGHIAYSSWLRRPSDGYEVVPDVFWCWGNTNAEELRESNPGFLPKSSFVAGGNLWLNRWRQPASKSVLASRPLHNALRWEKKILVTLAFEAPTLLLEVIAASPSTWLWMIRLHPKSSMEQRVAIMAKVQEIGHVGVDIDHHSSALLYELMSDCDVHVTESSSCAIEALAFGVRTVIMGGTAYGDLGKFSYRRYIEESLMDTADTVSDMIVAINSSKRLEQSSKAIGDLFANDVAAKEALARVLMDSVVVAAEL